MSHSFHIEVPFPNDLAPFKIIKRNRETGKGKIVDSAQTYELAKQIYLELAKAYAVKLFREARAARLPRHGD